MSTMRLYLVPQLVWVAGYLAAVLAGLEPFAVGAGFLVGMLTFGTALHMSDRAEGL